MAALTQTPQMLAGNAASSIMNQVNNLEQIVTTALTSGIPARPNGQNTALSQPAISAADLATALGAANVSLLQGAMGVLKGTLVAVVPNP